MLGKEIAHEIGQQTGVRVIEDPRRGTVMETTFHAEGTLLGVHNEDTGTYIAWLEPDGSLRGEGRGISMGEGGEMATWEATGVGHMRADGGIDFRGSLYYRAQTPKWAELSGTCSIYEYSTDAGGKTEGRLFLWE